MRKLIQAVVGVSLSTFLLSAQAIASDASELEDVEFVMKGGVVYKNK